MATKYTYPGVYVEEIPSGVRTIAGVSTSTACFIGWAPKGPIDRALKVYNFSDYERYYGGLHAKSELGYSVRQFFENGGSEAYILRLVVDDTIELDPLDHGDLPIRASSPGDWSQFYGVQTRETTPSGTDPDKKKFSLAVVEFKKAPGGGVDTAAFNQVEQFFNLSMHPDDARYAPEIVNDPERGSIYIHIGDRDGKIDPAARDFGPPDVGPLPTGSDTPMPNANADEFQAALGKASVLDAGGRLDQIDLFNLLCVPGLTDPAMLSKLYTACVRKRAFLIADCEETANAATQLPQVPGGTGPNGAVYFPWIKATDPLADNRLADFPPCGFVAGVYARTDAARGVWKAPAGIDASLRGIYGPKEPMTDLQNGALNVKGVNCIRTLRVYGTVVWGGRTFDGDDDRGSEWKYIPVRRTALFIEESLFRGLQWAVFEPNDEPLWAQIRLNVGAFLNDLFRQGAFQGRTARDAYFVKCDAETTTQSDINRGVVNIVVGFAPLKPAEFVVVKLTQIAGQIAT